MANYGSGFKFVDNSEAVKDGLFEQQKLALRAVAMMLKKRVKEAAPVDTGALKKNIGTWVRTSRKTGQVSLLIGTYNRKAADKKKIYHAFYAPWLELGAKGVKTHPFLKPTVLASISDIRNEEAKYLPDIKPVQSATDEDEEVAEDV